VNAIVKILMAVSTSNDLALATHENLLQNFTYTVRGQEVVGRTPNYHKMRLLTPEQLQPYIERAGFGANRSKWIIGALKQVYDENVKLHPSSHDIEQGNPPDAPDFVPGLLSLDFLIGADKVKILNWATSLEFFGVKSACCLIVLLVVL
jgi:endonuclease III